ncbi:glycosyltransferase family 2 protein [Alteraurantiacibacter aquimixticola]|uniref:Glycosyltransferase family 2 protein n=1 Tax=Alteraurantiacibacter aquimixticola TaxID=2489173 RepID=A0A4T3EWU6_9SPHN|nr:glycosyltransferase family 2 protein [Alteraurantiacibacter aquimixticola]TIX48963.1 glycosyltransferase family 2 protein [Alteraurantiacibacter aquimixticola]
MTEQPHAPDVSIIVVNYKTRELTCAAIETAIRETVSSYEIILVDNASDDGTVEEVGRRFPQVRILANRDNLGFAMANNQAAEIAQGRYLLLLNSDTVTLDGAIDKLLSFARRTPEARIWGGRTLFGDRTLNETSCADRMTLRSVLFSTLGISELFRNSTFFNPERIAGWKRDSERQVDIVSGCFFLIERDFWNELGGFDPAFFMFGEETDLCLRAADLGARPRITPEATIIHYGGKSVQLRAMRATYVYAARMAIARRHLPKVEGWLVRQLIALRIHLRFAWSLMGGEAKRELRGYWREIRANLPAIRSGPIPRGEG